ncbi:outer membrane protein assembly factor BamA [Bartonella henselae]|uniref:Outer membrane protein assembly factor BamA n=1 Tax=Bartonella henselae TaxID=38323 RepID=X5LZ48_BARHN|nr:outer membrane protein assembly factor BamA [Bartonella henselae]MDM9996807.1 outer membrane protein assembly factor BamA [Bartonella henselae]OLL49323.1 outer membrane protein assembly factor BamA [Bartonella henselae]OLL51377.1 outer membrane protein assembly factor BamA [Bartonella henselae]OLL52049.1 outer membrane protein assembly factor BamA [Bartonella henselae]OLL58069.1 outer membrane protein assembly factor BamA [Bartonella henselae]
MTMNSRFLNAASVLVLGMRVIAPTTAFVSIAMVGEVQASVVRSIEVHGNKFVSAQVVRDNINIKVGKSFSSGDVDFAVKRLFALGLFYDVKINQVGDRLVVLVKEYEVVNQVLFQGNKSLKDPDLKRFISLKPNEPFNSAKLSADVNVIREAYKTVGRNDIAVTIQTINLGKGRVNVVFNIVEGRRTKISNITFKGNHAFGSSRLRDVISTKPSGILSLLLRGDVYSEERLAADEEALRRFYYNRGYADFRVISSKAVFDEARNAYEIDFVLDEGVRYKIGDVQIESDIDGIDVQSMKGILKTRSGDVYSAENIEQSVAIINNKAADSGYAFAKVEPRGNRDLANHTISILYNIEQGPRAYVQRIEIRGNEKTRDYVIRREIDLNEGDAYNQTLVQRAKRRLESLGFFKAVNISMVPTDQPDQIILVVDVLEAPTGDLSFSGGYTTGGTSPGVSLEVSVTERNLGGRGQYVRLGLGAGQEKSRNYNLSFVDPYFLGYRLSAGVDIFRSTYRADKAYDVRQTGGSLRFAVPINDQLSANLAYSYVQEEYDFGKKYDLSKETDIRELYGKYSGAIVQAAQHSPWKRSSISYGLTYNTIDDMKNPHDGWYVRVLQEYAGLGGNAKFLKTTGKAMMYKTLSDRMDLVGLLSFGGGYIHEIGREGVRIFDMFKINTDMIRGFKYNGIGPRQVSNKGEVYFLGGTTYMNATAEVQFPIPVVPEGLGFRGALFADVATLYGSNYKPVFQGETPVTNIKSAWRSSAGVSLMWDSPFGPLRFDYAWPIKKQEGDRLQQLNFGISTRF